MFWYQSEAYGKDSRCNPAASSTVSSSLEARREKAGHECEARARNRGGATGDEAGNPARLGPPTLKDASECKWGLACSFWSVCQVT